MLLHKKLRQVSPTYCDNKLYVIWKNMQISVCNDDVIATNVADWNTPLGLNVIAH